LSLQPEEVTLMQLHARLHMERVQRESVEEKPPGYRGAAIKPPKQEQSQSIVQGEQAAITPGGGSRLGRAIAQRKAEMGMSADDPAHDRIEEILTQHRIAATLRAGQSRGIRR